VTTSLERLSPVHRKSALRNKLMGAGGAAVVVGMIALTYAAAPFFIAFCRATGYAGTPQRVEAATTDAEGGRILRVAFDANVAPGLPWKFEAETDAVHVRPGKTVTVFFRAENLADREITAHPTFNVTPAVSGAWFDKIQCFCFTNETLKPHEKVEWPVVFFLNPELEKDESMAHVDAITLSYTLFAAPPTRASASEATRDGPAG